MARSKLSVLKNFSKKQKKEEKKLFLKEKKKILKKKEKNLAEEVNLKEGKKNFDAFYDVYEVNYLGKERDFCFEKEENVLFLDEDSYKKFSNTRHYYYHQ